MPLIYYSWLLPLAGILVIVLPCTVKKRAILVMSLIPEGGESAKYDASGDFHGYPVPDLGGAFPFLAY